MSSLVREPTAVLAGLAVGLTLQALFLYSIHYNRLLIHIARIFLTATPLDIAILQSIFISLGIVFTVIFLKKLAKLQQRLIFVHYNTTIGSILGVSLLCILQTSSCRACSLDSLFYLLAVAASGLALCTWIRNLAESVHQKQQEYDFLQGEHRLHIQIV